MYIVKETMVVSRYYLVSGDKESVVESVKECKPEAEYLESCDELDWQGKIEYVVEELKEDWRRDLRLRGAARHIEARLSEPVGAEDPLTNSPEKRIMPRKKPGKQSVSQMLERVK